MTTNNDLTTTIALTPLGGAVRHDREPRRGGRGPRLAGLTGAAPLLAAVGRRAVSLAVAGALACLVLPPRTAHASQGPVEGDGAYWYFRHVDRDIDEVVAARKAQAARDYVELAAARSQYLPKVANDHHRNSRPSHPMMAPTLLADAVLDDVNFTHPDWVRYVDVDAEQSERTRRQLRETAQGGEASWLS